MTTSVYLILFSTKVLSNKPVFPYNSAYSACNDGNLAQIKTLLHESTLDIYKVSLCIA